MSDISKIKLPGDNTEYNIKDKEARTDIANAIRYGDFHDDYVETYTFDEGESADLSLNGHTHDNRYYTKTEADGKFSLISAISDMATKTWVNAQGFITSLAGYATQAWVEAKGYLTEHQSLSAYRTSSAQDTIDAGFDNRLDTIEGKESDWDNKSTVTVSASGTSTSEVQYITIDGVEKKLAGGGGDIEEYTANEVQTLWNSI